MAALALTGSVSAQAPAASSTATSTPPAEEAAPPAADPSESTEERIFAILDDLHSLAPQDPRGDLAELDALKRSGRSFDARLLGALARAYALRAALDGDPDWARRAVEEGRRAVQLNDNIAINHAGYAWGLVAQARFGDVKPEARSQGLLEAVRVFDDAASRSGDAAWVDLCYRAEALRDLERWDDAAESYRQAGLKNRLAWEPLEGQAAILWSRGRLREAAQAFEAAARKALGTRDYLRSDAARKEAEDVLAELSEHQRGYRRLALVRAEAEAGRLFADAAELWLALGNLDAAEAALAQPASQGAGRVVRARLALARGKPLDALAALGPPSPTALPLELAVRGEALRQAGRTDEAWAQLDAALKTVLAPGLALAALAELELAQGDTTDAARLAAEATARDAHSPERYELLARVRAAIGDDAGRQAALARAAALTAEIAAARADGTDLDARLRKLTAARLLAAHRYGEALRAIEPLARASDSKDLRSALLLASALAGLGRDEALPAAQKAIAMAPSALDVYVVAARASLAAKRFAQAREHALKALQIAPKHPDVREVLALINTAGVRTAATAQVEQEVARLAGAERSERLRMVQGHIAQRNLTALVLHLPNEEDDDLLDLCIRTLAAARQPDLWRGLETRALTLGPETPKAQLAMVEALAGAGQKTAIDALAAIAERPASPDVGQRAKEAVGALSAQLGVQELAARLDPSQDHHRVIQEAHDRQQEKTVETDVVGLLMQFLRYASTVGIVVFAGLVIRQRKRARQDTEARAERRRRQTG